MFYAIQKLCVFLMKMLGFFKRRNADCDKNGVFTYASRSPLRDR